MEFTLENVIVAGKKEFESKKTEGRIYYTISVIGARGTVIALNTTKKEYDSLEFGARIHAYVDYEDSKYGPRWTLQGHKLILVG